MSSQVSVVCIAFLLILQLLAKHGSSVPGHTSLGTQFSFAIPVFAYGGNRKIALVITTYDMVAKLNISLPKYNGGNTLEANRTEQYFIINRQQILTYSLPHDVVMGVNGYFSAIIIQATAPVKIFMYYGNLINSDFLDIIPKQSCYYKYHMVTLQGYPFMSVISFDHEATSLQIYFPPYSEEFKSDCEADRMCESGGQIAITLKKYTAWHFHLDGIHYDLQNTIVKSSHRVYTISGNLNCFIWAKRDRDICTTSPKPVASWGKDYVIPHFNKNSRTSMVYLRFIIENFPFKYTIYEGSKRRIGNVMNFQNIIPFEMTDHVVLSSHMPFGLGLFVPLSKRANIYYSFGMVSLSPVEQWLNGAFAFSKPYPRFGNDKNIFIVSNTNNTKFVVGKNTSKTIDWKTLNTQRGVFFVSLMKFADVFRVFTQEPKGKVMVYMRYVPSPLSSCLRGVDFYLSQIYSSKCVSKRGLIADGVDNDCDGVVDEELQNGEDDDGDGRVDEDSALLPGLDSSWTSWISCSIKCNGKSIAHKVRSCKPAMYGRTCRGKQESCKPQRRTCPKTCGKGRMTICSSCLSNCLICNKSGTCDVCKTGFFTSDFCLAPCPGRWKGKGCHMESRDLGQHHVDVVDKEMEFTEISDTSFRWWNILSPFSMLLCLVAIFAVIAVRKWGWDFQENSNSDSPSSSSEEDNSDNEEAAGGDGDLED